MQEAPLRARATLNRSLGTLYKLQAAVDQHDEEWRARYVEAVTALCAVRDEIELEGKSDPSIADIVTYATMNWKKHDAFKRLATLSNMLDKPDFGLRPFFPPVTGGANNSTYGFLFIEGTAANAVMVLWAVWTNLVEKVTDLERLTGRLKVDGRDKAAAQRRFISESPEVIQV
jgi:hypothetical protein